MSCRELTHAFYFFANEGYSQSGKQILNQSQVKRMNALMQTCGFYDESGEFYFSCRFTWQKWSRWWYCSFITKTVYCFYLESALKFQWKFRIRYVCFRTIDHQNWNVNFLVFTIKKT